jgi:hypothetical protein
MTLRLLLFLAPISLGVAAIPARACVTEIHFPAYYNYYPPAGTCVIDFDGSNFPRRGGPIRTSVD